MNRRYAVVAVSALVVGLVPAVIAPTAFAATSAATTPTVAQRLAPVAGLTARPTGSGEQLTWTNPTGSGYSSVVVRRMPGDIAPSTPSSGSAIGRVAAGTSTLDDPSAQPRTVYSYAAFAIYPSGHSAAATTRAAFVGASTGAQPQVFGGGSITGKVTDAAGDPLRGVEVTAVPASPVVAANGSGIGIFYSAGSGYPHIARTAADGTYTLDKLTNASYRVCFTASSVFVQGGDNDALGYDDSCLDDDVAGVGGAVTHATTAVLADNTGGAVSGVVLDAQTGDPVAGVLVSTELDGPYPTDSPVGALTDAHGAFRLSGPVGSYSLCVEASFAVIPAGSTGYLSQCGPAQPVVVFTPGQVTTTRIHLGVGAAITGVLRGAGGAPLGGYDVSGHTRNGGYADVISNSDGSYTLTGLPAGKIQVCSGAYLQTSSAYAPSCTFATGVRAATSVAPDLVLPLGGVVSGRVTSTDGSPVGGVSVQVQGRQYVNFGDTAADGTYSVGSLPAGVYQVCFSASSYPPQCFDNVDPETDQPTPVRVVGGKVRSGVDATLDGGAPGAVTVHVQDSAGHPLLGADVVAITSCSNKTDFCDPVSIFARPNTIADGVLTGAGGSAAIDELASGRYAICVFGRDATRGTSTTRYQDTCTGAGFTVAVKPGATTYVTVTLLDGGAVTGTVTDTQGHPLAGVDVQPSTGDVVDSSDGPDFGDEAPILTGADGSYRVSGLPAGTTTLCFDASAVSGPSPTGYANQCYLNTVRKPTPITIATGAVTTGIDAQLRDAGAISGTVTDAHGTPVPGVDVEIDGRTTGADVQTDPNGNYVASGLPAGQYLVCFLAEGAENGPPTGYVDQCYGQSETNQGSLVKVTSGHTTSGIDVALQVGGAIAVTVTSGGQPIDEGFVEYQGKFGDGSGVGGGATFEGGSVELTGLQAGSYKVCVADADPTATPECYDGIPWNGNRIPAGATKIAVKVGQTAAISVDLPAAS